MTAMQTSRVTAKTAFELLQCLSFHEADFAATEAKLAKLQAVHCCVRLLCPQHPAAETQLIATGGQLIGRLTATLANCQCTDAAVSEQRVLTCDMQDMLCDSELRFQPAMGLVPAL